MDENPYLSMLGMFRQPSSGALRLTEGKITALSPLKVRVDEITLVSPFLRLCGPLAASSAVLSGTVGVSASCDYGGISSLSFTGSAPATITPKLAVGDHLLLLTPDDQIYYALCKVVS